MKIKHFFSERNFDVRFIAAVGDFEALSENNLTRMNLTFEQFVKSSRYHKITWEIFWVDSMRHLFY